MHLGVVGTGYVGLVSAACLADSGHRVAAMDADATRISRIAQGDIPIYEPGLNSLVQRALANGNLELTTDFAAMLRGAELVLIAVGTPTDPATGAADLTGVRQVAASLGRHLEQDCVVVNKSTVPVGTSKLVQEIIDKGLAMRGAKLRCEVASNPEFLKEGSAVEDFLKPDRIVIGCTSDFSEQRLRELYQPFNRNHDKIIIMDTISAELTKYAANCMLATKISFINQVAGLAEVVGADIEMVRRGIGSDPRIGYHFIYPGMGYGGSCFPKDVRALIATMAEHGVSADLLETVERVNQRQKKQLFTRIQAHYKDQLEGKTFAVWGLAFKPNTDDMREAPSLTLIKALHKAGAIIQAYDPRAMQNCRAELGEQADIVYADTARACLEGCDALIVCTEWREFRSQDWQELAVLIADKVVFDGRNMYLEQQLEKYGLVHYPIGTRPRLCETGA